ncbi:MAG: hypothetical protein KC493_02975 [Bacteriovoracaceae bacterium]|nr:hypothetical protein [Bacteriovoracaceae bacterium]
MMTDNQESVQLLNTAIIKSKEKKIDSSYEQRLSKACNNPAINALTVAINHLAETQNISNDQAAMQLIETVRELDSVWTDYVMMEGIGKLKELLKTQTNH